ncbi:MAG: signal peptidase I [Actinomycetota bacterium]
MTDHEFRPAGAAVPPPADVAVPVSHEVSAPAPGLDGGDTGPPGEPPDAFWDDGAAPAPRRNVESSLRSLIEWVAVAVAALAVALLIKGFLLQAFYIPSESMTDTLHVNDRVLVNKLSYRIGDVDRGDIIVFEKPPDAPGNIEDFIKRVIALPGETISFADGDVFIDGQLLNEPYLDQQTFLTVGLVGAEGCVDTSATDRCTLEDDFYFVLGDNRANSTDSRAFGPIHEDTIVGRAFLKVWPLGDIGFL